MHADGTIECIDKWNQQQKHQQGNKTEAMKHCVDHIDTFCTFIVLHFCRVPFFQRAENHGKHGYFDGTDEKKFSAVERLFCVAAQPQRV